MWWVKFEIEMSTIEHFRWVNIYWGNIFFDEFTRDGKRAMTSAWQRQIWSVILKNSIGESEYNVKCYGLRRKKLMWTAFISCPTIAFICDQELRTITKTFHPMFSWFVFSLSNRCRSFKHLIYNLYFFRGATHQSNIFLIGWNKRLLHRNAYSYKCFTKEQEGFNTKTVDPYRMAFPLSVIAPT